MTEKTYRTILMKQPFLLFSNPYALKYLRNAGYKTFSPLFNESYDTVENLQDRQNLIVEEVIRLNRMPDNELQQLLVETRKICNYNYELLMERKDNKYHNTMWTSDAMKPYVKGIDVNFPKSTLLSWHNKY